MFCLVCGQPVHEEEYEVRNGSGTLVAVHKELVHSTAGTYPQLNDHPAVLMKASWEK